MKRRDFIKMSSAAGVAGVVGSHIDTAAANPLYAQQATGFDLHPFIKANPDAVFINITNIKAITDQEDIINASNKLAQEMFVSTSGGAGFSNTTKIAAKPNWTGFGNPDPNNPTYHWGIHTDMGFIEGFLRGVKAKGPQNINLGDCAMRSNRWDVLGHAQMCERNNFNIRDLSTADFWDLGDQILLKDINNGEYLRGTGYMVPLGSPDSFLINMAKFKTHSMGVTVTVKNLQGMTGRMFHRYCDIGDPVRTYEERYHRFFRPDCMENIVRLHEKHVEAGIPRWASTAPGRAVRYNGQNMERWAQRMLDNYSVLPIGTNDIHIAEGIYGRDGDGFMAGPWEIDGRANRAKDYMCNYIMFGRNPFNVDIIAHWLAGHEPGNFGLFHLGIERGFSKLLDPLDVPLYVWENGQARRVNLDTFKRWPLVTPYLPLEGESIYHLCDEPFDYKAWKATGKIAKIEPSIKVIGTDSSNNIVMDMSVPKKGDVLVDILNKHGDLVGRLHAPDLEPGNHQVVWDGFGSPGMYTTYVKGMGWDAENEMVIYT